MTKYVRSPIKINDTDDIEKPILGYISTDKDGIIIGKKITVKSGMKNSIIGLYAYKAG
jgi:hypothetical protein